MPAPPLMLTHKDDELLGVANRSDAMGLLPVWSFRARDLVPHLTEQTTNVRGFQMLVEIFRLWEIYEPAHPEHAGRLDDFFVLVEQAFARTVGKRDKGEWNLPGRRRVRARSSETPHISLKDRDWHLLGEQKSNGVWGLYRGASRRAGLLDDDMRGLSDATLAQANAHTRISGKAQARLFDAVTRALGGETVALPEHGKNHLVRDLCDTLSELPLAAHLEERLIEGHELNHELARRLLDGHGLQHRILLTNALSLDAHRATIGDVIRCENLLAVVESVFFWLCASKGKSVETAAAELPDNLDLDALGVARAEFVHSGWYGDGIARTRQERLCEILDTSSRTDLARSVLRFHEKVGQERKRAAWVWEEHGVLHSDVDMERPDESAFEVGVVWRNDYYLRPLALIAEQLAEVRA